VKRYSSPVIPAQAGIQFCPRELGSRTIAAAAASGMTSVIAAAAASGMTSVIAAAAASGMTSVIAAAAASGMTKQ